MEAHVKFSKAQYDLHLISYIKSVVRRPLGKLLEFFEGVEDLLKTKTPEEITFHLSYNKASLKKMLSLFPIKEVSPVIFRLLSDTKITRSSLQARHQAFQ